MNGYNYQDMIGRSGQNLVVSVNGKRTVFYGEKAEPSVLTLNGEEAQLSDQVSAEDWIVFVPASHGKSASAMLSDIEKPGAGKKILVNGIEAIEDISLKTGDSIVIEIVREKEILPEEDWYEEAEEEQVSYQEPASAPQNIPGILTPPAQMTSTGIQIDKEQRFKTGWAHGCICFFRCSIS